MNEVANQVRDVKFRYVESVTDVTNIRLRSSTYSTTDYKFTFIIYNGTNIVRSLQLNLFKIQIYSDYFEPLVQIYQLCYSDSSFTFSIHTRA